MRAKLRVSNHALYQLADIMRVAYFSSSPGQRYPVPGASTTLFFTDFGRQLQANWASNFFRKAISNVKRIVEVSGGVEPIESGKYVLKNYGLEIKILDGQRYSELKETMSNQVLLDALRGLNQYFIEKRGGYYYEAVFDVRVPKDGGNGENIVGHAFFRLQKTSNCLDLKSFDLVDVDSEDVRSEEVD